MGLLHSIWNVIEKIQNNIVNGGLNMCYTIGIVGAGFVGCTYAKAFIDAGFNVLVNDINGNYAKKFSQFGYLPPVSSLATLTNVCDIVFICLPTPPQNYLPNHVCRGIDINTIDCVLHELNRLNDGVAYRLPVCIKSTLSPKMTDSFQCLYDNLELFFSPEFLTEDTPLEDVKNADRIVIGQSLDCDEDECSGDLIYILESINTNKNVQLVICSNTEAELIKLMSNTFLATKVIFANTFYNICKEINANYNIVQNGVILDSRIGNSHLNVPGPDGKFGYSKSCFPKDMGNIVSFCQRHNINADLLDMVQKLNSQFRSEHDWVNNRYRNNE